MSNVFSTNHEINVRYDLKGSTYGRYTVDNDPTVARKDQNFLADKEKNLKLNINKNKSMLFFNQLEKDCKFFEDNDIIDYSLLLGLHAKGNKLMDNESSVYSENPQFDDFSKMVTVDNQYTLYIGIIDIIRFKKNQFSNFQGFCKILDYNMQKRQNQQFKCYAKQVKFQVDATQVLLN